MKRFAPDKSILIQRRIQTGSWKTMWYFRMNLYEWKTEERLFHLFPYCECQLFHQKNTFQRKHHRVLPSSRILVSTCIAKKEFSFLCHTMPIWFNFHWCLTLSSCAPQFLGTLYIVLCKLYYNLQHFLVTAASLLWMRTGKAQLKKKWTVRKNGVPGLQLLFSEATCHHEELRAALQTKKARYLVFMSAFENKYPVVHRLHV